MKSMKAAITVYDRTDRDGENI